MQETIIGWLPDSLQTYAKTLTNFFTTLWFARVFPELVVEHGLTKKLDIRCGTSK